MHGSYPSDSHQVTICCSVGDSKEDGTGNNRKSATAKAAAAMLARLKSTPKEKSETVMKNRLDGGRQDAVF